MDNASAFLSEMGVLAERRQPAHEVLREVVQALSARLSGWDWVGIYLLVGDALVLGPYVGETTEHVRIPVGTGVCGTAVAQNTNITVDDVRQLDNYLACSLHTRSELVVLIRDEGEVVGQFDVDSDRVAAFTRQDELLLEQLARVVSSACRVARDQLAVQAA